MLTVGPDMRLKMLKTSLSSSFEVEDLGAASQVLWMKISKERLGRKLKVSQESSCWKVVF